MAISPTVLVDKPAVRSWIGDGFCDDGTDNTPQKLCIQQTSCSIPEIRDWADRYMKLKKESS